MKKAIYIILACVVFLAGCSNETKSAEMTTTETSASIAISGEASSKETTEQTTTAPTTASNTAAETTTVTTEAEEPVTETASALQTAITETAAAASAVTVTSTAKTTASTTETSVSETKASESEAATESAAEEVKIVKVISSDNPRSLTKEDKEILANMPEIVFIKIITKSSYGKYVYGYYLNNKGEVRYYNYDEENEIPKTAADGHIYADYFDAFSYDNTYAPILLDRMHDKIIEKSEDTGIRVEKDKLVDMYKQFLSIDTDAGYDVEKVVQDDSYIFIGDSYANLCRYFYGFRKTDGTEEKVMIDGLGRSSYTLKDTNAYLLNMELCTEIFPIKDYEFTPQLVQIMLGKTPPVTTVIKSENPRELTQEDKDILNEMPEILFIMMEKQFFSEESTYGFYLNNKGEVRYYEYYDKEVRGEYERLTYDEHKRIRYLDVYSDNDTGTPEIWKRMYEKILKKSIDTGIRVEKDKLVDMYKMLLRIDDKAGFNIWGVAAGNENIDCGYTVDGYYWGIKNKTRDKVMLVGYGYSTYENKDPLADELLETVGSDELFPGLDEMYIPMIVRDKENTNND